MLARMFLRRHLSLLAPRPLIFSPGVAGEKEIALAYLPQKLTKHDICREEYNIGNILFLHRQAFTTTPVQGERPTAADHTTYKLITSLFITLKPGESI